MPNEVLHVQLVETFSWLHDVLIPGGMAILTGLVVGYFVGFGLRKKQIKDTHVEKLRREKEKDRIYDKLFDKLKSNHKNILDSTRISTMSQHQCIFTSTYILGKTVPTPEYVPEYPITWLKLLYVSANRFNPPRYVISEYLVFWF